MASSQSDSRFFHESWYRIAGEHVALRASVRVRRQLFRGSRWYVLHEPFSDQFFRLRPPAYDFVSRLDTGRTVDQVWRETIERDPENAPGQEEVIQLLSQLYHANLLHYDLPADSEKLFDRYKKRKQSVRHATMRSIMFFRIPLFDPNGLLRRMEPFIRAVISPVGALVWVAAIVVAIVVVIGRFSDLRMQTQGILSLANLPLLYLAIILIKTLHEFGHAAAVRRFGGSVHTMGIMFLIFNPLPYTDSTAAWSFRSKWRRVLVGAAGMVTELFVAALAVLVWANTGPGALHALAYNMMIVASISTIVLNINPLMRFDGYYILADLLDIPNLHTRASGHLRHLVERYAFGYKKSESPAMSRSEATWLSVFGVTSGIYRVVVFASILLIIADRFLLLGIIMAAVCAVAWVLAPMLRLVHYLATSPRLERTRLRATLACVGTAAALVTLLAIVPFPNGFKAPGILQATDHQVVVNNVPGYVSEIVSVANTRVNTGDVLVRFMNSDLGFQLEEAQGRLREANFIRAKAFAGNPADLRAVDDLIVSIEKQISRLQDQQSDLIVRAETDGVWVAPNLNELRGRWLPRGTQVGEIINDSSFYFASVISEENASEVFSDAIRSSEVRLVESPGRSLQVTAVKRIPIEQTTLPSAALGFQGGGSIATSSTDATGSVATQPFYELRLAVANSGGRPLYQGVSGRVRFQLQPEPLLVQALRKLRQLVQARYQL